MASYGGQCVDASASSSSCGRVIDGNAEAGTTSSEWAYSGAGVGSWVQINFTRKFVINTIRVKQRANAAEQNKGLKLTFMDGSEEYVSNKIMECIFWLNNFSFAGSESCLKFVMV